MPPKKTITEETFQTFQREVERNSQYLVSQLLEKINKLEEKCNNIEEQYKIDIEKNNEDHFRDMRNLEQQNLSNIDNLRKMFIDQKQSTHVINDDRRNSNIEISKPIFHANGKDPHPIEFLQNLEEYFKVKQMNREERLIIIRDCLKNAAGNWYSTIKFQIRDYADFRNAFIDEFWSRQIQIQTWSNCLNTTQIPDNVTYREHFSQWASKLRHLQVPELSEEEIVSNIANHYPGHLRAILVSLPDKSVINAMKVLGAEESRRDKPTSSTTENNTVRNNQHNNTWSHRVPQNDWSHRPQQRGNNQPRNNRWNNRDENPQQPQQPRDTRQQINQVVSSATNDVSETSHQINKIQSKEESYSPYIKCIIEDEEVELLVDTGATISVLTKEIVDTIIKKDPTIPQLPINGIRISNAIGKQICKISKQIFCKCQLSQAVIHANFIQVEGLNEKGIIGADILNQHNAQINFSNHTVQLEVDHIIYSVPFSKQMPKPLSQSVSIREITLSEQNDEDNSIIISQDEQEKFNTLMEKYHQVFSDCPGKIKNLECQIRVTPGTPIYQKPYPVPVSKTIKIDQEIQRMLDLDIIERSNSPWSSPMVGVEKKNGDVRVCLDARKINTRIIPDRERPMNIDDIMNKFKGVKYLSSIDLTAGYWQCSLKKECREVTAFLHKGRNYQYKVLPFGLVNSVAEFQKILDQVLGPDILEFVAIYVDDLHITSNSFSEHMDHLEAIFTKFTEYNVKINIRKSHFLRKKIIFLGHVISEKGITMDPEKVQTVQNFQPPQNKKQIQAFLGFINFYRKFIRDLSEKTSVLSALIKKGIPWQWGTTQQQAFEEIKAQFLEDIIIQYPDFNKKFYISTDASNTYIGAELFQKNEEGQHQTLSFISRTLNTAERNYGTTELELLAIVFACKKFRNYILGHETHLLTDHQALTFLNSCQLLNARLTRWTIKLQEYQLIIEHIPGKENIGADTLTRYPQTPDDHLGRNQLHITINKLTLMDYSPTLMEQFDRLRELQQGDEKLKKIFLQIASKKNQHFFIFKELLFTKNKHGRYQVMIPQSMNQTIVQETHERYGHMGTFKVYQILKLQYKMINMYRTIKRIVKTCDVCQKAKFNNQVARGPNVSILPDKPLQLVSLDLMGPLPRGQRGAKYILAILDVFSKFIQLYPIKKANADTILRKIIHEYIPKIGPIDQLLTDNGTQFHSKQWFKQLTALGIRIIHTTTYHPESNPVERANREIGRMLRTYCHSKHTNWVKWLPNIEYWINHSHHDSTGYTPHQVLYGEEPNTTIAPQILFPDREEEINHEGIIEVVRKKLRTKADARNRVKDQAKKFIQYQVGQQVLVKEHRLSSCEDHEIHKFFLLYRGPYTLVHVSDNNTVLVEDSRGQTARYNIKNVKPYHALPRKDEDLCFPPDPGKSCDQFLSSPN